MLQRCGPVVRPLAPVTRTAGSLDGEPPGVDRCPLTGSDYSGRRRWDVRRAYRRWRWAPGIGAAATALPLPWVTLITRVALADRYGGARGACRCRGGAGRPRPPCGVGCVPRGAAR